MVDVGRRRLAHETWCACQGRHRALIESANDLFGAVILSQLSLLPDGASLSDLKSLFPLNHLHGEYNPPEKVLRALSLAYYDRNSLWEMTSGLAHPCLYT